MQLETVTLEGLHFRKQGKGGSYKAELPFEPEVDAFGESWNAETSVLTYYTPNDPDEEGNPAEPTEHTRIFSQQEIDDAALSVSQPDFDFLKATKEAELKAARDAMWTGDLVSSFGVPFKTDVQTQLDISFMIQNLAAGETFSGYKCADGVRRDITKEQFQQALGEGIMRKVTAYTIEGAKLAELQTAYEAQDRAAMLAISFNS